jgi:pyridoxal phosphate enzyme (YggS family)
MLDQWIGDNLTAIQDRIDRACDKAGRDPASVTLIAVTKTIEIDAIRAAYDLGMRHFGENRLQEGLTKIEKLPNDAVWHFIGKLQSNKAKKAAESFAAIHTLETESQLKEIDKIDGHIDCLVEVNVADEPQKSGIPANLLDEFVTSVAQYSKVRFRGLMTVGPAMQNQELMRPYFERMRKLRESVGGDWLSMGMSHDFEVAIQEGATHVRVGTALFGARALT